MEFGVWLRKRWYIVFGCIFVCVALVALFITEKYSGIIGTSSGLLISFGIYKLQYPDQ